MAGELRDKKGRPFVVVTGMGVVSSLAQGVVDNWAALTAGRSGIRHISRFPTDGLSTTIAATVDFLDGEPYSAHALSLAMATASASEAIAQANIGAISRFPGPLFIATPPAEFEWPHLRRLYHADPAGCKTGYGRLLEAARSGRFKDMYPLFQFASIGETLAERFGNQGQPVSVCTACASGASAIALGTEAIRAGTTDAALCVATDGTVHVESLVRFSLLSAMSTCNDPPHEAPKPFARNRDGFVIGEGAAALVLESYEAASARGAPILGFVRGCGEKADDYHRTRSKPDGSAMIGAICNALNDAGIRPEQIDYINAHGTSTKENDKMEYLSLKAVFGERISSTPVSSNKSIVGHTLIAAGAVEAVFSLLTIQTGTVPPTLNCNVPDPDIPLDVVRGQKRQASVTAVLSNSFGFGGQNACLVLSSEPV